MDTKTRNRVIILSFFGVLFAFGTYLNVLIIAYLSVFFIGFVISAIVGSHESELEDYLELKSFGKINLRNWGREYESNKKNKRKKP